MLFNFLYLPITFIDSLISMHIILLWGMQCSLAHNLYTNYTPIVLIKTALIMLLGCILILFVGCKMLTNLILSSLLRSVSDLRGAREVWLNCLMSFAYIIAPYPPNHASTIVMDILFKKLTHVIGVTC